MGTVIILIIGIASIIGFISLLLIPIYVLNRKNITVGKPIITRFAIFTIIIFIVTVLWISGAVGFFITGWLFLLTFLGGLISVLLLYRKILAKPIITIFTILTVILFIISVLFIIGSFLSFSVMSDVEIPSQLEKWQGISLLVGAALFSVGVLFTSLGIMITILLQQLSETKKLTKLLEKKEKNKVEK